MGRLQPGAATYGCSLRHLQLQPTPPAVAACAANGCSLRHLRLQDLRGFEESGAGAAAEAAADAGADAGSDAHAKADAGPGAGVEQTTETTRACVLLPFLSRGES